MNKLKFRKPLFLAALGLVFILISTLIYFAGRETRLLKLGLQYVRIEELPNNATNIKVASEGGLMSRTVWIYFQTNNAEIEKLINTLKSANPTRKSVLVAHHPGGGPKWFQPNISMSTVFEIPQDKDANYGTLFIDTTAHSVYIKASHS